MSASPRRPLTVWDLPKLLEPVHRHRPAAVKSPKDRPHFPAILAFVYRNRFAIVQQIQRRFGLYLPSDRTARRQLAEMEALGYLDLVPTLGVSPLFPKVYSVSRKGLRRLREAVAKKGKEWREPISDRRRAEGYSALHVMHELCITEFLLENWEESQSRPDFDLLQIERRSLARHPAFVVTVAGHRQRLIPDAMYLYREPRGMMCCFLEIDLGTMSMRQMEEKFRRYSAWSHTAHGREYLMELYRRQWCEIARSTVPNRLECWCRLQSDRDSEKGGHKHAELRGRHHYRPTIDCKQGVPIAVVPPFVSRRKIGCVSPLGIQSAATVTQRRGNNAVQPGPSL